jgi:hypothetical protein
VERFNWAFIVFGYGAKIENCPYLLTPWSRVLLEELTVNFAASQGIPHILPIFYQKVLI